LQKPPFPCLVAWHCAKFTKPQFSAPPIPPPYSRHHGYITAAALGRRLATDDVRRIAKTVRGYRIRIWVRSHSKATCTQRQPPPTCSWSSHGPSKLGIPGRLRVQTPSQVRGHARRILRLPASDPDSASFGRQLLCRTPTVGGWRQPLQCADSWPLGTSQMW
jgi:hypothetical protein